MLTDVQFQNILYFLIFFKFVFIIFYTLNIYGLLFNHTIYDNTLKWVIVIENIFLISMGIFLLYRFSKDTIQVSQEERLLIWTLTFFLIFDGFIKAGSVEWF
jgi:cytochrome c biogenesis protein CcdA